jgi:hypothetical protein
LGFSIKALPKSSINSTAPERAENFSPKADNFKTILSEVKSMGM